MDEKTTKPEPRRPLRRGEVLYVNHEGEVRHPAPTVEHLQSLLPLLSPEERAEVLVTITTLLAQDRSERIPRKTP